MAPPLSRRLPKVTEYVKNVGKSIGYSAVDYFKGSMSDSSEFIESNQELFRDIVVATKNYKRTLAAADRAVRQSKIYEAGTELKKTLFESIRTGKFYDEERENYYRGKAAGSMGDMSDMDDWGFDTDQFDVGSESFDEADSANIVSSAVKDSTVAQANVIAKSSEYLAEINKASTRLLFTQGERMYSVVNGGLANTQSLLTRINDFLMGPMTTHMENSKKFYETTTNAINEINANLKELTEMQRNLYKREQAKLEESAFSRAGGVSPDLRSYAKEIKKNFMEVLGPEVQMLLGDDMGEGSNMLMAMVANPLKGIPDFIVKSIVPHTIKRSLEALDESFSSLFANFIARMNKASKADGDSNIFMHYLGRIFGLKLDTKSSVDPSKYEKGPVPFDGITRKTIVDVIPGHLARIEAALTNRTERIFDYESGKWTTADKLEKDFKDRKARNIRDSAWDVSEEVRDYINGLRRVNEEQAKKMQEQYDKLIRKIYEDGYFTPYKAYGSGEDKQNPWDYFDMDKETFLRFARMMVGTAGEGTSTYNRKRNATRLAGNILESKEQWARYLRDVETKGYSAARHLFNGAYDYSTGSHTVGTGNGTGLNNIIADAKDKYNKNIFYYLQGIYAELTEIRSTGGMYRGGGKKGKRGRGPRGGGGGGASVDPRTNLERNLQSELDASTPAPTPGDVTQTLNEYDLQWDERVIAEQETSRINREGELGREAKGFLEELLQASSMGAKFRVIKNNLSELTKKPGLAIAGVIDQADRRIFQLLFGSKEGEEIVDEEGNKIKGFLDYIINRTKQTFDKMNDFIDDQILRPIKEKLGIETLGDLFKKIGERTGLTNVYNKVKDKVKYYAQPTVDRLKEKLGWGWGQFKGSMGRTYGTAWNRARGSLAQYTQSNGQPGPDVIPVPVDSSGIPYAEEDDGQLNLFGNSSAQQYMEDDEGQLQMFARGSRRITKRGLAILSPGERVVPVGGRTTQRNNLTSEVAFARQHGLLSPRLRFYAAGTDTANPTQQAQDEMNAIRDTTQRVMNEVMGDTKHKGLANVIASSLIGGGASILTGMIGGPLLGAAAGAAFGIAQNSETVQNWLFGEEVTDTATGETSRKGGFISKELQEKFKKYFPSMRDFGLAGAVAGLFTPFGLVGGLMAGSAIGFAKETDSFQDWLFGKKDEETKERDGGLIKKEFRDKVKKAAPRMLIGAAGTALLGPFGLLGNAVLGSALGFVTTTDKFHDVVFGKEDENGKKKGGIVPAIYRGLVKPLILTGKKFIESANAFIKKRVFKPLNDFVPAFIQMIKNGITSLGDSVKNAISTMLNNTIGRPIHDFLEHTVFKKIATWTSRILKLPVTLAKGVISAPFAALGAIGNNIRRNQIAKGTAGDMTAQQRVDWRNQHRVRMFGKEIFGHDKYKRLDEQLAGLKGQEGLDKMKQMKELMSLYLDTRGELGKKAADLVRKAGEILSEFLNGNTVPDDPSKTIYQATGSKLVKNIHKAIKDGDVSKVQSLIDSIVRKGNMSAEQAVELMNQLNPTLTELVDTIHKRENAKTYQKQLQGKLGRLTGGTLSNIKNIRRYSRLIDKEIDTREAELAKEAAERDAESQQPEVVISDAINESTQRIIDVLTDINENLRLNNMNKRERRDYLARKAREQAEANGEPIPEEENPDVDEDSDVPDHSDNPREAWGTLFGAAKDKLKGFASRARSKITDSDLGHKVSSVGGMISGKAKDIKNAAKNLFRTAVNNDGTTTIVDANGRPLSGDSNSRNYNESQEENEQDRQDVREMRNTITSGIGSIVGGFFGGATNILRSAKDGLFGIVSSIANSTGIVGKIFGGLGKLGLLAIAVAGAGHFMEMWNNTLWPAIKNFLSPAFNWIKEKVTAAWDWLGEKFPKWFGEEGIFGRIGNAVEGILTAFKEGTILDYAIEWIKSGWTKFADYVIIPIMDKIAPRLSLAIYNGIHSSKDNLLSAIEDKSIGTQTVQKTNEAGEKIYIDNITGKETTSAVDSTGRANASATSNVEVQTTEYGGFLSWFRNQDWGVGERETLKTAKVNGYTLTCITYTNGTIVVRCDETEEYIRIDKGFDKATKMTYGMLLDENGKVSNASLLSGLAIGGFIGYTVGAAVGTAAGTLAGALVSAKAGGAIGAAVGTVVPGVGNVIGAAVGVVVGAAIGIATTVAIYHFSGGGYSAEQEVDINSVNGGLILARFGLDPSMPTTWPAFTSGTSTPTADNTETWSGRGGGFSAVRHDSNNAGTIETDETGDAGSSRKRRARARHIYQNDPALVNTKFGNSTLGDAGCGPVAATNLMNQLGSNMSLGTAAQMALPYQTSDGGVTTDYFTNLFNSTGVGGTQSDSKSVLANSIKNGRPTVLLGRSSTETGTPFGANDHYITAMGTDGRGNVIVEDPDLPGSSYKYPLSKVMNDTTTGIMTGQRRRRGMKRRYGFERTLGDTSSKTQTVSAIVKRAYDVIHQSEGDYSSVNMDDNGALSIGKIQWHAERAFDIAKRIMDATGPSQSLSLLGNSLYNEIATGTRGDWEHRKVSSSEADKIGKFISTDIGKTIQDLQGYEDIQNYIDSGKSYGLTDENALIYYADMYNQGPKYAIQVVKAAIKKAGSASAVTLDIIHKCALENSVLGGFVNRRTNAYNIIKNGTRVGTGTYEISTSALSTYTGSSQYTSNDPWSSAFSDAGTMAASAIFGEGAVSGIMAALNKNSGATTNGVATSIYSPGGYVSSVSTNGYGVTGSAGQQSVVNKMASIQGKLKYSLDWDKQDPDKGVASCASTVGWAYKKALGVAGMDAGSTEQAKDDRFVTIWTANGKDLVDPSILQPGDTMYYNWDRRSNNGVMQHTEMYAGNNKTLSHGGNPAMGPVYKDLNTRTKNLMMVRRYKGFLNGASRRRGYARAMTSGVDAHISDNAKRIISQYGISTTSNTPAYTNISSDIGYQQFLSVMIDLLAVIADNTKGIADLQKAMSSKGIEIDTSTIEKAAANARRRAARARTAAQNASNLHMPYIGSQEDIQNMMNTPTGYMVQAMEALASE